MKLNLGYWAGIALLATIHLHALLLNLPFEIQIYFTLLPVLGTVYYFYNKISLSIPFLGITWNSSLFFMQILLIFIYFRIEPSWVYLVPNFIFIGIETIRIFWAKQLVSLSKSLKNFEEQSTQLNETFRQVRSERHDFLKHVSAIHYLLENNKHDEAKTYLDDLVGGYEETNLSIRGERGIVAGVLHQMYRRAKDAGIAISYDFDLPLSSLPLTDQNMITLMGNLLSNSIEACEEWQKEQKEQAMISLQFYKRSGLYLLICKNNTLPIPTNILDGLFQTYGKTTKNGAHKGLGTNIIHNIVKDHQGFLDFVHKNQEITIKIKIPAIR